MLSSPHRWRWHPRWVRLALPVLLVAALLGRPARAAAHPLGNFSVNRYSSLELGAQAIALFYVLDLAEIPTFQAQPQVDGDGDGTVEAEEQAQYGTELAASLQGNLHLTVNGAPVPLALRSHELTFPEGQGGLLTTRLELRLEAALPAAQGWQVAYRDDNFADRLGWQEIVVRGSEGAQLLESSAPAEDLSQALRVYPADLLQSPLTVREATFSFEPGAALNPSSTSPGAATVPAGPAEDGFARLITTTEWGVGTVLAALLASFGWGAAHAMTPGHGKTIVAAYLVGSRGTARHAVFLGLTTTVTHTAGVFALGFVTLFLSRYILPERLYPWLGVISGLLVVTIGLSMFGQRLRSLVDPRRADEGHDDGDEAQPHSHGAFGFHTHAPGSGHAHNHLPPAGRPVTWRGLLALGISGGLLPCPSALVVLLSAIALQRVGLGMLLIVAFSLGLASVLMGIGLLLVHAGRLFERIPVRGRGLQVVPVVSALLITLAGVGITAQALAQTGLLQTISVATAALW